MKIETDLLLSKHGMTVILVRPLWGTQSDSWSGVITTAQNNQSINKPSMFQVQSIGMSLIFTEDDVWSVDVVNDGKVSLLIRLKSPNYYV